MQNKIHVWPISQFNMFAMQAEIIARYQNQLDMYGTAMF